jgi:hypothetical protein
MQHQKMKIKLPTIVLAALLFAGMPLASSSAFVAVSVAIAPPVIPVYEQPLCPTPGYLWTPGYWDYANFGYYWVPGVWVAPPRAGLLWTPGYWGFAGGRYVFNRGYWGPTVGFYGGIDYGFGYVGHGYYGGRWDGGVFRYNTAVSRVNTTVIHNTYVDNKVASNNAGSSASFNGPGGATAKPTAQEQAAAKAPHVPPTSTQRSQATAAKNNPATHFSTNKGKPPTTALAGKQTGVKTSATSEKTTAKAATIGKTASETSKTGQTGKTEHTAQTNNRLKKTTTHPSSHMPVTTHNPELGKAPMHRAGPPQAPKKGKKKNPPGQG